MNLRYKQLAHLSVVSTWKQQNLETQYYYYYYKPELFIATMCEANRKKSCKEVVYHFLPGCFSWFVFRFCFILCSACWYWINRMVLHFLAY